MPHIAHVTVKLATHRQASTMAMPPSPFGEFLFAVELCPHAIILGHGGSARQFTTGMARIRLYSCGCGCPSFYSTRLQALRTLPLVAPTEMSAKVDAYNMTAWTKIRTAVCADVAQSTCYTQ